MPAISNLGKSICVVAFIVTILITGSCTSSSPDPSAPQRLEVERSADWQGALLYLADENGPDEGWGSIRIYDNVSGFVETTVEQTFAAAPSDVFVSPDGSTMYVSSLVNGRIDIFRWDGSNWNRGTDSIESPTLSLLTLVPGPGGELYAADGAPGAGGRFYILDTQTETLDPEALVFPFLRQATGIAWSTAGTKAYISGAGTDGPAMLAVTWPSGEVNGTLNLPIPETRQLINAPDDRYIYVMGLGGIIKVDTVSFTIAGTLNPAPDPDTLYVDGAFSTDGRYLFTAGAPPGGDSTLYVIDLQSQAVVHSVNHISRKANGMQRVE